MTSFIESRFPDDIRYGVTGGPEYSTTVITVGGGAEQRNRNWQQSRGRWTLDHGPHELVATNTLIAFFRAVGGRALGFRFKDWTDYAATTANGVGVQLTTTTYQLAKTYTLAGQTETRNIYKPVSGTVAVYVGGVLQSSGYALDTATGVVTFSGAPGGAVTWAGEFDVPARFDSDTLNMQVVTHGLYEWGNINIVEIRP